MAKFLDKKERVIDFKLTNYGHYLLSNGTFKPVYYAFYDDNVLYDGEYAGITDSQNSIHGRIKEDTPYIESLTLFSNIDYALQKATKNPDAIAPDASPAAQEAAGKKASDQWYFEGNMNPTLNEPDSSNYRFNSMIGDAALDGNTRYAAAWKIVALQGQFTSSAEIDVKNEIRIPQINIDVNYALKVIKSSMDLDPNNVRSIMDRVVGFSDGNMIQLVMDDPLIYGEELNTQLFNENFDVEVFKIMPGNFGCSGSLDSAGKCLPYTAGAAADDPAKTEGGAGIYTGSYQDVFERKYFLKEENPVVDGFLKKNTSPTKETIGIAGTFIPLQPTADLVSYYFNVVTDQDIDQKTACKGAEVFNKSSYYIDLEFDCAPTEDDELVVIDIYGRVTESEICQT
jgi:hypothetical protein